MSANKTVSYLKAASAVLIGFGLSGLLAASTLAPSYSAFMADLAFFPFDGSPSNNTPEMRLLWAIAGGLMAGWGVMIWQITSQLYPRDPALAKRLILSSVVVWFVIDGAGSVLAGAPFNVVMNTGFLAIFVLPLMGAQQSAAADAV